MRFNTIDAREFCVLHAKMNLDNNEIIYIEDIHGLKIFVSDDHWYKWMPKTDRYIQRKKPIPKSIYPQDFIKMISKLLGKKPKKYIKDYVDLNKSMKLSIT